MLQPALLKRNLNLGFGLKVGNADRGRGIGDRGEDEEREIGALGGVDKIASLLVFRWLAFAGDCGD